MLAANQKKQAKKKFIFFSCGLIALWLGLTPVFAGGISDLLFGIVGTLISIISMFILGVIETVASAFLTVMAVDIATIETMGFLRGFNEFVEGVRLVAVLLASACVLWQLFNILMGPFIGTKQVQSIGGIITRALIFIPLSYFVQGIALDTLRMFQSVYTEFFKVYEADASGVFGFVGLSTVINPETFLADLGISTSNAVDSALADVVSVLISCLLMIIIAWNLVKLLLEMTQRFVVMLVYVYLSPLAAACGVGVNSINISKQSLTLFLSSGILWILNVWSVGIALSLLGSVGAAIKSGVLGFFLWAVITYGFLKVAQQLDDVFKAVGATNVGFSGSLLDDILSASKLVGNMGKTVGAGKANLNNFAEKGFFGVKGKSSENPTKPENKKIISPEGFGKATGAAGEKPKQGLQSNLPSPSYKSTPQGKTPTSVGQQAKAFIGGTAAGQIVRGLKKTGENIGTRVNNGVAAATVARDNGAMNAIHGAMSKPSSLDRASAMKNLAQNNPAILNNNAAKEYVGEAIGLNDNQSVAGLSVNKEGQLSATVASRNADGSVGLSKKNNLNDASFGASNGFSPEASATVGYSGMDGSSHSAQISKGARSTTDGGNMSDFSVTPSDGGSPINVKAPANMSAEDVGSVISGTASEATMQSFTSGGGDVSAAMSALNIDPNVAGSVSVNSGSINSDTNNNFGASIESTPNSSTHSGSQFSYQSVDNGGTSSETSGYITPTGNVENGKVEYQYGHTGSVSGTVLIDSNATVEEITAALANQNGGGIEGIQEVREKLGISTDYNDNETKSLRDMLAKAKKAESGSLSSKDAPVGKYL